VSAHDTTASFEPVAAERKDATHDFEASDVPVLVVQKGTATGERFYLEGEVLSMGRDPECDIFLNDVTVSRRHAVIHRSPDGVTVTDADSLNGTYVNGVLVDKAHLRSGDALQVGRFRMVFLQGGDI
jgi:pSer/pThr/pTyr-binding forkhead associated (FHA) protein